MRRLQPETRGLATRSLRYFARLVLSTVKPARPGETVIAIAPPDFHQNAFALGLLAEFEGVSASGNRLRLISRMTSPRRKPASAALELGFTPVTISAFHIGGNLQLLPRGELKSSTVTPSRPSVGVGEAGGGLDGFAILSNCRATPPV
jgi:hypothetical protein